MSPTLRRVRRSGLLVFAVAASGCASGSPRPAPPPRLLAHDLPAYTATDESPAPLRFPEGELTLRAALAAALLNDPELAALAWERRARDAETLQAGRAPNPELSAELENAAGSGPFAGTERAETTFSVLYALGLGGTRGARRRVAEGARAEADWAYEIGRIETLSETTHAFIDVLAAEHRLEVADRLLGVAEEVLASVSRRVQSGAVSPVEESRARVELETSRIDHERAARDVAIARQRLAGTWGESAPRFTAAVGALDRLLTPRPPRARIEGAAERPHVARWVAELERRRAELDVTRSQGTPDVRLGAGIRHFAESGDRALVLGLEVPLPLFDRNRDAARAAAHRVESARHERRAAEVRVAVALANLWEQLTAAESEARTLDERILPEAERSFATTREAYQRGRMRLTDVLDARRSLFELRGRRVDALARYHHTVVDIERLLGEPLVETPSRGEPTE